ncbi:MarR family winged helix-turn-helix transcriptional regulator [Microbacterium gorillae]|uniref:MarR family winged helix-turn-helix transcriptional regulator n=1 Tax=Microbacterium gorillae TaxID=1231063 RepID=UPI00058F88DB|nr:MarR family transcriptional regulator [Microbacterium gorillae]
MTPPEDTSPKTALTTLSDAASLRMATMRLARRLRNHRAVADLSDAHFSVLGALHKHGPFTLGQLATHEGVSAPSMNRTVNALEENGYIARTADDADGRKVNITLTDAGSSVVADTIAKRDAWLEDALADLDDEEHDILVQAAGIMRKVADR